MRQVLILLKQNSLFLRLLEVNCGLQHLVVGSKNVKLLGFRSPDVLVAGLEGKFFMDLGPFDDSYHFFEFRVGQTEETKARSVELEAEDVFV